MIIQKLYLIILHTYKKMKTLKFHKNLENNVGKEKQQKWHKLLIKLEKISVKLRENYLR